MHHPKEAVIDGVKFVLIPEELAENIGDLLEELIEGGNPGFEKIEEIRVALEEAL